MGRKLILGIDFNNMMFGSYYAAPLLNDHGMNVNAIKGFFFKLKALKETFNPDMIVFANDISRERTFRRKLFADYKAQRKSHDDGIITQMRFASQIAALLGYQFINNELYEADDILGMVSRYAAERDYDMIIASSDRDLYQLVNDHVYILSPRTNNVIDKEYMYNKYQLTPDQWIELKMLQGDRSDNIPGVPGVGEKTALSLMQTYGSIDNIYSHLDDLKPGLRNSLISGKDVLPLTRTLVTIITDYTKINLTDDMIDRKEIFIAELLSLIAELQIYSLFNVMNFSLIPDKLADDTES
jgi:DNA polymerase-1